LRQVNVSIGRIVLGALRLEKVGLGPADRVVCATLSDLVVAGQLLGVDDRQHLAEALADAGDSLAGVPEGKLAPRHVVDFLAVQVDEVLLATRTSVTAKVLATKHGLISLVVSSTLRLHQVVEVLDLTVKFFESLFGLSTIGELLSKTGHHLL